jgi:Rrf2 family iron-sulfur cluster assembly transcriptional regulator
VRLTVKSRYALRALIELAKQPNGKAISLPIIAKRQRVKPAYLEQILFRLRRAKLINGKKGPGGGFLLARDPKRIKLKDVLNAVGESTAPVQCLVGKADKYCAHVIPCPMQECWSKLKREMDSFFSKYTLYDVCSITKRRNI